PLPDGPPGGRQDLQLAALGVEGDVAFADDGSGGAVVGRLVLPGYAAGDGVEGVKLVTAEAPTQEDEPIYDGGGGQGVTSGEGELPPAEGAILVVRWLGSGDRGELAAALGRNLHGFTSGCWGMGVSVGRSPRS